MSHNARLVIGSHMTNTDELEKYAANISLDGVKLQLLLTARPGKPLISDNVGIAFLHSYTKEKIWAMLGPEFGQGAGRATVIHSLYGLITSAHEWFHEFTKTVRDHGFIPSKVMSCLWYTLAKDVESYDYLSHHVENFLLTSEEHKAFMIHLRKT